MSQHRSAISSTEATRVRLDHLVHQSPTAAIELARQLLAETPADPTLAVIAWSGIGRSLYELGELDSAVVAMRRATARRQGADGPDPDQLMAARMSAAVIYAEAGESADAERELDIVESDATGTTLGRVLTQRSFVLSHGGSLDAALATADRAAELFDARRDRLGRLRLLLHRSVIQLQRGDLAAAKVDLRVAQGLAQRLGQDVIAATVVANLGVAYARAGQLSTALEHFDDAEAKYVAAGKPLRMMAIMEADRAEALRSVGRHAEAVRAATVAVGHAAASGNLVVHGDAELALAHSWWAAGDAMRAEAAAGRAAALMLRSGRRAMSLQTRALGLEMTLARRVDGGAPAELARARRLAARLEELGWSDAARRLRAARLRNGWMAGRLDDVADDIERLASMRRSPRPEPALVGWYAEALRHWALGDRHLAGRAASRGLDRFRRHSASAAIAGSSDLLSLDAEVPATVHDLERVVVAAAVGDGRPHIVVGRTEAMRQLTDGHARRTTFSLERVRRQLADRTAMHFVVDGDAVWATTIDRRGASTTQVAAAAEVRALVGPLLSWLDRGATTSSDGRAVRSGAARSLTERLERLLLPHVDGHRDGDGDGLVIIPDDLLVDVPWSGLPIASRRPLVVVRSLTHWCDAGVGPAPSPDRVTLLVGPSVEHGRRDRRHIEDVYAAPHVFSGRHATVAEARAALQCPGLVHVSAHGSFRADEPTKSSIRLADGEATLDDLAPEDIEADLVILASCETAGVTARRGAQMYGYASELVRRGARAVLAPTTSVADKECAEFVGALHRQLVRGVEVGRALANVRSGVDDDAPLAEWAVAASFVCVGDDQVTVDPVTVDPSAART